MSVAKRHVCWRARTWLAVAPTGTSVPTAKPTGSLVQRRSVRSCKTNRNRAIAAHADVQLSQSTAICWMAKVVQVHHQVPRKGRKSIVRPHWVAARAHTMVQSSAKLSELARRLQLRSFNFGKDIKVSDTHFTFGR